MLLLRLIGRLFLILALALLGLGLYLWLGGEDIMLPAGKLWFDLHVDSLQYVQVIIERHLGLTGIWQNWIQNGLLQLQAWDALVRLFIWLLVLAGIFMILGRDRSRPRYTFRKK
ncbi:hypothetical protein [Aestuariispira insulae]|uniref:Uncharacterized protein n=1 Tax=Aestuariispira insulae TaxID=1461337 RepID=A0A3D9H7U1_9PROT|nr:hypothetical protein [Aestuariispira insulae]RED45026.1 hypothetical protein DFP90_11218 [Aestuariispira insulae]